MALLEVQDIQVYYGMIQALKGVSFSVNEGEVIALIGANGAGKTTTLHTVTGLLRAKSGHIIYDGQDITKVPPHKIVTMGMAHVPEGRRVFANMTVLQNLKMGAFTRSDKNEIDATIEKVYKRFPRLKERQNQTAGTLSGGEQQMLAMGRALMSQNKTLRNILEAVYRMAVRKQRANLERPEGEKYAELQRVRLGSRLLAYLPMRINDELVDILREFKEKASAVGVKQFIIQTHFQTPLEVTPEAKEAIRKILSAGWIITNQLVYTVAASRRGHTTRLRQVLNSLGVVCYYTFSVKGFNENYAVFAPNSRSMQEQQEEKIYGQMTPEQAEELYKILETKVSAGINEEKPKEDADTAKQIRRFMRKHHLPFLATDRSVLNLPAIGKSMTFQLVGLTEEGKRILRFEHDGTRHHSPIIDQMGQIYIVENKSLAAYLRQLSKMGEDPEDYASIWSYTKGETEPRFSLYEYPDFPFRITDKMSNLEISNRY